MGITMSRFSSLLIKHWLGILGLIVIFFYLTTAFQIIDYPDMMFTVLFLAISPVAIIGVYSIKNRLAESQKSIGIEIAMIYGIIAISGLGLLILNLWTFPYPPGESGLIDLGPLTGIWWIWVVFLLIKIAHREEQLEK